MVVGASIGCWLNSSYYRKWWHITKHLFLRKLSSSYITWKYWLAAHKTTRWTWMDSPSSEAKDKSTNAFVSNMLYSFERRIAEWSIQFRCVYSSIFTKNSFVQRLSFARIYLTVVRGTRKCQRETWSTIGPGLVTFLLRYCLTAISSGT